MAFYDQVTHRGVIAYEQILPPYRPTGSAVIRKVTYTHELAEARPISVTRKQTAEKEQPNTSLDVTYPPEYDHEGNMTSPGSIFDRGKTSPLKMLKPVTLHVDMAFDIKSPHTESDVNGLRRRTGLQPPLKLVPMIRPSSAPSKTGPLPFPARRPPTLFTGRASRAARPKSASNMSYFQDNLHRASSPELLQPSSRPQSPQKPSRPSSASSQLIVQQLITTKRPQSAPRLSSSSSASFAPSHRGTGFRFS
eukprot:TRINITY_DN4989_c0_g1_i4.p1 TRINITY_DN4989_c0_g1~~TRINITY_DN4989_c0_g1_i4.p1  ORF type:complete len:250 (+),score=37.64 TRINITY_DN4989_c0_g1_i4:51-800(+)